VGWNEELENQVQEFQRQAVSLAEWDKKIIRNAERMTKLNTRVTEIENQQRSVEQNITYVTAQQAELESLLDGIDRELPKMVQALGKTPLAGPDADRAKTIELAETVQLQLNDVSGQLSRMVDQINNASVAAGAAVSDAANADMVEATQILNNHFEVLSWIETQILSLQKQSIETQRMGDRAHAEHDRLRLYNSLKN
jgi:nuclear pore complex protein Nup62